MQNSTGMGHAELTALWGLIGSNIGLVFSICVCILGLYQWLVKGNTGWGLILLALSMFLPFFSNIISGTQVAFCPIIQSLGGQCAGFAQPVGGGTSNIQM